MIMQIAPDVDGESLRRTVENEIATQDTQYAKSVEEVLAHASMVAQEEGESAVDSIHIRRALLALRGIGAQPEGSLLSKLGLNLIEQAQAGNLPPVVGRDAEISQLVEILCRPINPYAVLVGSGRGWATRSGARVGGVDCQKQST